MGWWSTSPLGGDEPLDLLYELEEVLGVDELYPLEDIDDLKRKRVQRNWDWEAVANWLFGDKDEDGEYLVEFIPSHLVVCVGLACGVEFTDYHKEFFTEMIDEDEWAKESEERKRSMDALKVALLNYEDGVPTFVDNPGVLEVMMED
jgi:hypothetical protein